MMNHTISDAADYAERHAWKDGSRKHREKSSAQLRRFMEFVGGSQQVADVSVTTLLAYTEHLEKTGAGPATINRSLAAVSKMLRLAAEAGHIETPPRIPRRKEPKGRIRYFTEDEEQKFLQLCSGAIDRPLRDAIIVSADTGVRISELLRITRSDVMDDALTIWQTKNATPRTIPLTARASEVLNRRRLASIVVGAGAPLFGTGYDQHHVAWNQLRAAAGLSDDPQAVWHTWRHTCASRLVQRGVSLPVVQQWMGHKSINVTMKYAHLNPTALQDAVNVLEKS